jgi:acetolactate synthase I/II/III large subunit
MKVSDYIARQLFHEGVRYVFGIPGGASIPWMESFRKSGIEFILTSHESAAGIMACVSSRLTGIPGVCHSTFGPGATNLSTGAGCALLDRDRILVLTSEMSDEMLSRTSQMNIDHQRLFAPVSKATFRLSKQNAADVISKSLFISGEEKPGPVHIGLPEGVADADLYVSEIAGQEAVLAAPYNDEARINALLKNSRRPVIVAGLTAARLRAGKLLTDFLNSHEIPVLITPMAKGLLPEDHPSFAGVLFHAGSRQLKELYQKCDLVIGIGYDPVEYNYESWMPDVPLIHFDTRITDMPEKIDSVQYCGASGEWFSALKTIDQSRIESRKEEIQKIRRDFCSLFSDSPDNFGPVEAVGVLRKELPAKTILTADVGSHLHLLGQLWKTGTEGKFVISNGWSGMGFGIPAANAAALCLPGSTVVCVTGDGGFLMSAGEVMTARRYGLPVIIVVFSDGELNLIRLKEEWKNIEPYGTEIYSDGLFNADTFLGIKVLHAPDAVSLRRALKKSLELKEPVIINVEIDASGYRKIISKQ